MTPAPDANALNPVVTLNRGLANVRSNGYVMFVSGELILDDLSSAQTGMFTGGNNSSANSTGGVYVDRLRPMQTR